MKINHISLKRVSTFRSPAALCAAVLSSAFFLSASKVNAEIIYQDTFASGAGTLNGSTVETSSGTQGGTLDATWLSGVGTTSTTSVFNFSGSGALNVSNDFAAGSGAYYAFLPLAIETGKIYTLTVDINPDNSTSSNFLGIGFSNNNTVTTTTQGGHSPWVRYARNGSGRVTDGATELGTFGSNVGTSAPIRATLTLDTTDTLYTVGWSMLNLDTTTSIGSGSYAYTTNPTITHVFLNSTNSNGTFDNFQVTAIPEPSSILLLGGGLLLLLGVQKARSLCANSRS